jgi:hypothetical protein
VWPTIFLKFRALLLKYGHDLIAGFLFYRRLLQKQDDLLSSEFVIDFLRRKGISQSERVGFVQLLRNNPANFNHVFYFVRYMHHSRFFKEKQ